MLSPSIQLQIGSLTTDANVLPDDPTAVLRPADDAALAARIGDDIVTASGTTLLGADNKSGVAAIMTAAERLVAAFRLLTPRAAAPSQASAGM